jgi:hypothetical protein
MALTISSISLLTPADLVSTVSSFYPPVLINLDIRRYKYKIYRRVYLKRSKKPRTG